MKIKLDTIDARLVTDPSAATDREDVFEASSGAVWRFYAEPKGQNIGDTTKELHEILYSECRRI